MLAVSELLRVMRITRVWVEGMGPVALVAS